MATDCQDAATGGEHKAQGYYSAGDEYVFTRRQKGNEPRVEGRVKGYREWNVVIDICSIGVGSGRKELNGAYLGPLVAQVICRGEVISGDRYNPPSRE
jgi:hypothetical protein